MERSERSTSARDTLLAYRHSLAVAEVDSPASRTQGTPSKLLIFLFVGDVSATFLFTVVLLNLLRFRCGVLRENGCSRLSPEGGARAVVTAAHGAEVHCSRLSVSRYALIAATVAFALMRAEGL
jgi:hypothetical protein